MLEILYRIYEVTEKSTDGLHPMGIMSFSKLNSCEIAMDCMICEDRQSFKDSIKDLYGKNIKFAYSRKYPVGTVYCIIIGEHCYDAEKYFNRIEYTCADCGVKVVSFIDLNLKLKDYEIKNYLCNQTEKYANLRFCSHRCKEHFIEIERKKCLDDGLVDESYITQTEFKNNDITGYIYKISKKSTGEFYVGKTIYLPIFRWGQHLKTTRFPVEGILDYQFEVIEIVGKGQNILDREKYWIQKMYMENPSKLLNIACTSGLISTKKT